MTANSALWAGEGTYTLMYPDRPINYRFMRTKDNVYDSRSGCIKRFYMYSDWPRYLSCVSSMTLGQSLSSLTQYQAPSCGYVIALRKIYKLIYIKYFEIRNCMCLLNHFHFQISSRSVICELYFFIFLFFFKMLVKKKNAYN